MKITKPHTHKRPYRKKKDNDNALNEFKKKNTGIEITVIGSVINAE